MNEDLEGVLEYIEECLCRWQYELLEGYINDLQQENKQLRAEKEELKKWLENYFQGKTINDIPIDDFYKKGMYRMVEYTLDKIKELEEGVKTE